MKQPIFTGSAVAIITPFQNESVDYETLGKLLQFQLSSGNDLRMTNPRPVYRMTVKPGGTDINMIGSGMPDYDPEGFSLRQT